MYCVINTYIYTHSVMERAKDVTAFPINLKGSITSLSNLPCLCHS